MCLSLLSHRDDTCTWSIYSQPSCTGTYAVVKEAVHIKTGKYYACKVRLFLLSGAQNSSWYGSFGLSRSSIRDWWKGENIWFVPSSVWFASEGGLDGTRVAGSGRMTRFELSWCWCKRVEVHPRGMISWHIPNRSQLDRYTDCYPRL